MTRPKTLPTDSTVIPLARAYELMRNHFGHHHWWPGDSSFEVCVGAILTQSTSWQNVERALGNLKRAELLNLEALKGLDGDDLADLIRPAGYARVKAKRLMAFIEFVLQDCDGELEQLFEGEHAVVRSRLLSVNGVGPETADCIMLYAGARASFVVDAYTRRIFGRHGWISQDASYSDIQSLCETELAEPDEARRIDLWQDYHAQLVNIGKWFCRPKNPKCEQCPLGSLLPSSLAEMKEEKK